MRCKISHLSAGTLALAALAAPGIALAQQKSEENAVTSADDAFGTSVGLESTGIYTEYSARGFSPLDAGNARIDGIYFDPVSLLTHRVKVSQAIRIGYAALEYPFAAPTGIVDNKLRSGAETFHAGLAFHLQQYGSYIALADIDIPVVADRLTLATGVSTGHAVLADGSTAQNYSYAVKPVIRFGATEISPFYSVNHLRDEQTRQLVVTGTDFFPNLPKPKRYFGQRWAQNNRDNVNYGVTFKSQISDRLSVRAGLFNSSVRRRNNFTEYYLVRDPSGLSDHGVIADPVQDLKSWSGEAQAVYGFRTGSWRHRLIAGFRGRDRSTEFGGSDYLLDFPEVHLGERNEQPRPVFDFSPVNRSKVRQTSWLLGYLGKIDGIGLLNLGLQRASFRGSSRTTTAETQTRENLWLYNASIGIELGPGIMLYGGTQRGLEDLGAAPETASNRNDQLPPARSTQYEAGLSWKFRFGHMVVSVFQITKPYYSFDEDDRYVLLGTERHRGAEASMTSHFFDKRLTLLLGAMVMKPEVYGSGLEQGLIGKRPVSRRGVKVSIDANYRTDLLSGFTPTFGLSYRGKTAAVSVPYNDRGDQLLESARSEIDIGFRQPLKLGAYPATITGEISNILNERHWLAIASRTLTPSDGRRYNLALIVDF